ncbi:RidA family protein [Streptomyces erythrochromogenes]|uniref:RidA family protein n=1 Tax=Streptomyces erythrochromogenes TaxID=285574 RepID=UPI00331AB5E3
MAITLINPAGLPKIDAYRQVSVATGSKLVFVAGQVSWDADGVTVGEGDWTPDKMPLLMEGITRAAGKLGGVPVPPATLLGVAALDVPEHLVEVEATAVLD